MTFGTRQNIVFFPYPDDEMKHVMSGICDAEKKHLLGTPPLLFSLKLAEDFFRIRIRTSSPSISGSLFRMVIRIQQFAYDPEYAQ
jgi:hypothetical protein